jgi:hypothetical protein
MPASRATIARLALLPMVEIRLFPCPAFDQPLHLLNGLLSYRTFGSTASVPAFKQDHLEQCVSQHREPLVRFVGAHPGSVECFQKQVVILESVADGELDGFASFLFA